MALGIMRREWTFCAAPLAMAAPGMPNVEVAGLTIVGEDRVLYAATHGLSAWRLRLP